MARLDTHWHANPRILGLGLAAMGLHAWSISYCDAELTDGFIPDVAIPHLKGAVLAIKALVDSGRWEVVSGGYRLHDYLQYNRSRELVLAKRDRDRTRQEDVRRHGVASDSPATRNGFHDESPQTSRAREPRAPVPVPVPGIASGDSRSPPTPSADADAQGGSAPRVRSPQPNDEPLVVHADAGVCPLCRRTYLGSYIEHTAEAHKVHAEPANLGRSPMAPPPEVEAEFAAMHERLQALPENA
ncbi:MAG TPA: hypothetical protein VGK33_11950 [Chloroflexota bacterium]|jgi:hypothetical protein